MNISALIEKYNVPGPRYTSYPTVPYWDPATFTTAAWLETLARCFAQSNAGDGISVYIHLPFCSSLCTFCGCTKRITRKHEVEEPYVEALLKEWRHYCEVFGTTPRIREIHLGGGTPTFFSPANLRVLIEGLLERADPHPAYEWGFEAHPNSTSEEHLDVLRELGFTRLSLGVQDFDPEVQQAIHRIQPYETVVQVTAQARALGYNSINYDLVFGLPRQKLAAVRDTVGRVIGLRPDRIAFYSYAHVPWIRGLGQRGFSEADLPKDAEKRELYETGRAMLEAAGYREIGMDHFALASDSLCQAAERGELHRNFMGYTRATTRLMIGLGMSAIGDTWYGFAQNEKKVEDYERRVMAGEWPVFRGHILDPEDLLLRRHILDLMCRLHTEWNDEQAADPVLAAALGRLDEVVADGFVVRGDRSVSVTEPGRAFLRNICMAFDARLWRHVPETRLFSQTI